MKLENRVAVVTGAGRGIGKAIATRLALEGARVAVVDTESAYAEHLADKLIKSHHDALAVKADVSVWTDVERLFAEVETRFHTVHILVNNAGIRKDIPLHKMTDKDWDAVIRVQTQACFNCCRAAQKYMVAQKYGRIINISSPVPASLGERKQTAYAAANAAIDGFTRALALELGPSNVTVNAVAPDYIDTELLRNIVKEEGMYIDDYRRFATAQIPLRRMGTPEDVAGVVQFLASDDAAFVTGQVIQVKGGP
ncbi:MAG: 3-oxoacyl-ACP reductase FabG [Dehalococcoidia bacterium]|nr:3-oxoacyl-ACP reductase FabG [Dehalococcoidia bacterium]